MNRKVQIYSSFKEENAAEYKRRSQMNYIERMKEFSYLQERQWGSKWTSKPMIKKATYEKVTWY